MSLIRLLLLIISTSPHNETCVLPAKKPITRKEREEMKEQTRKHQEKFSDFIWSKSYSLGRLVDKMHDHTNANSENMQKIEDTINNHINANFSILSEFFIGNKTPLVGDHIYVQRIGYTHHGIYIDSHLVIHFLKDGVTIDSLSEFCKNKKIRIMSDNDSPANITSEGIVDRAYNALLNDDSYNLLTNNCEHFARWCRYEK